MTLDVSDAMSARAIEFARDLLGRAAELQTPAERRQQAEFDRMIGHDADKATLVEMTDQAFRTSSSARVADQLTHVLDLQGVPRFFSPVEKAMLKGFQSFGEFLPGVAVPLVKEKMRRETANVILPAEPELLAEYLTERQQQGVVMNVNLLGEALLGEDETRIRFERFVRALQMPEIQCLSVKISTLYSQISALTRQHTIAIVADRLESLYRTALQEKVPGTPVGKFVYLDMEEYRDLSLTAAALKLALARRGLEQARAGIALQAYIPDSYAITIELIDWSAARVRLGAEALTIRLVKGANMELERVEAAIAGWPQAPYLTKQETDANYKRMLKLLIEGAAAGSVRVGVASHNLFDVALAILWTQDAGVGDKVQFEMLEGMANHQRRAITEHGESMVLYAPACSRDEFLNAIGYLIRRLDENTGPDNFLRHAYQLSPGSPKFQKLAHDFSESLRRCSTVSAATRRTQDRRQPPSQPAQPATWNELVNEPDTDWSLPYHVTWIQEILNDWQTRCNESATRIDTSTSPTKDWRESFDPSRPDVVSCRYVAIPLNQVHEAVERAKLSAKQWGQRPLSQRHAILREAAQQLRRRRGDLIAAMVADGGKVVSEADPEVSEAIDFCEFYPLTMRAWSEHPSITTRPRGVVGVITPWNFPLAIPCGGIAASLAAGNSVLLKPASETVMPAYVLCQAFWDAGVPHEVLQLVPCDDRVAEHGLVRNDSVDAVILTGATSTAQKMLAARPGLYLLAETGGKNATIVTAMADRDLAIKHVIQSAFGHAGQKCSATSLLLLEDEVFKDPRFRHTLADAVQSLRCGSAWDLATRMGPLIGEPNETLMRGMQLLEDDESWLVEPEHVIGNPNLFKPGVKWNVRPGSFSHMTELFGPVLSVMRFSRLEEAIEIVRGTGYGLTSGLESLDGREIELWQRTIHAGNLYVNRSTTGAIVLRQPFGGVGLSAYGPGVKAGGPHYVLALSRVHDAYSDASSVDDRDDSQEPQVAGVVREDEATWLLSWLLEQFTREKLSQTDYQQLSQAIASQLDACREEFDCSHDTFRLLGQDNYRRYKAVHGLTIRCTRHSARREIFTALAATILVGTRATVSMDDDVAMELQQQIESLADEIPGAIDPLQESTDELISRMTQGHVRRLRVIGPAASLSPELLETSGQQFVTIVSEPVLREGRIECLRYLDEQSLCHDYHRYGNLGRRTSEVRRPVM